MLSSLYPRLISLISGLRLHLIVLFMFVVMVAVGTVALVASQASADSLQLYIQADANQHIISMLLTAYQRHESQQALQTLTEQLARSSHQRIILFDYQNQRRVIADSDHTLIGQVLPASMLPVTTLSPSSSDSSSTVSPPSTTVQSGSVSSSSSLPLVISTDTSTDGPPQPSSQEAVINTTYSPRTSFLTSVNHALWLAVLIAGLVALPLALVFANTLLRPLQTLKAAAEKMEQGDLSQRVFIKGKSEIGALAHSFNMMAESLSRSEQARRNLVSDVAHELRNPLMNIRGYLELLIEGVLSPTPHTLTSLYEETSLLNRLVADLQEISLAEAGQLHLALQSVDLMEVISQAVQIIQPQIEQKHLTLHVHLPPALPYVEVDPERVAQILRNLLRNAITHTPDGGEISITADQSQAWIHISVQDTGTGIAPEHLPHIFERFYRADPSRARATGGTGLGLAVVKQMVQAHGGQITVASQPGQGSRFTLTLPVSSNPDTFLASSSSIPHINWLF